MKLQHFILAGFIITGSFVILPTGFAVSKSSFVELRVRTVPGSSNDQKKKEESKTTPVKPEPAPAPVKVTSVVSNKKVSNENCNRTCSQSEILKNTQWAATGGKPE